MKGFVAGVAATGLALAGLIVGAFFLYADIPAWYNAYSALPVLAARQAVIVAARKNVFVSARAALDRQADIAVALGLNRHMGRDLVDHTYYVMQRARLKEHYAAMIPWLDRLDDLAPGNYLAQLMHAEAHAVLEPGRAAAFLAPVRDIAPAHDRAYRPVVEAAVAEGATERLRAWCEVYRKSQFGTFDPEHFYPAQYLGQSLGFFFLELINGAGKPVLVPFEGIRLGERRVYEFLVPAAPAQDVLTLHFPILPGVMVEIERLSFIETGGETRFEADDLTLVSRFGWILDDGQALITSYAGDVLSLTPRAGKFPVSDIVRLDITFRRLPFTNHDACRETPR